MHLDIGTKGNQTNQTVLGQYIQNLLYRIGEFGKFLDMSTSINAEYKGGWTSGWDTGKLILDGAKLWN